MRKTIVQGGCQLFIARPHSTAALRIFSKGIVLTVAIFLTSLLVTTTVQAQGPYSPDDLCMVNDMQGPVHCHWDIKGSKPLVCLLPLLMGQYPLSVSSLMFSLHSTELLLPGTAKGSTFNHCFINSN
jgi:hypothetical protein